MLKFIIGAIVGGLVGYGLYRFVGCSTGACPMTSNPYVSTIGGAVLGLLFAGSV